MKSPFYKGSYEESVYGFFSFLLLGVGVLGHTDSRTEATNIDMLCVGDRIGRLLVVGVVWERS